MTVGGSAKHNNVKFPVTKRMHAETKQKKIQPRRLITATDIVNQPKNNIFN